MKVAPPNEASPLKADPRKLALVIMASTRLKSMRVAPVRSRRTLCQKRGSGELGTADLWPCHHADAGKNTLRGKTYRSSCSHVPPIPSVPVALRAGLFQDFADLGVGLLAGAVGENGMRR